MKVTLKYHWNHQLSFEAVSFHAHIEIKTALKQNLCEKSVLIAYMENKDPDKPVPRLIKASIVCLQNHRIL